MIVPERTLTGFNFSSTREIKFEDCSELSQKSSFISLATRTDITDDEKIKIQNCLKTNRQQSITINGLKLPISQEDKSKVLALKQTLFSVKDSIFEYFKKYSKIDLSEYSVSKRIMIKKVADEIDKSKRIVSKLLQIHLYSQLKLKGKVSSLISSIVGSDYLVNFYNEEFSASDEDAVNKLVMSVLIELYEKSENRSRFETLIAYLLINADEKLRKLLSVEFDIPDRLSFVREKTLSFNNAARFPYAWSFWIEKYSSEKELLNYINRALVYDRLKTEPMLIINFHSTFPLKEQSREKIVKAFKKLSQSSSAKEREVSLRLLSENKMASLLSKEMGRKMKPLFQLEKKFYTANLEKKQATLYSIYRLLKLGLFEDDFLLYIYASRL